MHASASAQIERLTDELRQLAGRGAKPMRLVTLPTLRELSRVDSSLTVAQMGSAMYAYLADGISTVGTVEVEGNTLNAQSAKLCLRLTLKIKGRWLSADERRFRVLQILGSKFPLSQMRRPHSPERELLRALAAHLVEQSEGRQTAT